MAKPLGSSSSSFFSPFSSQGRSYAEGQSSSEDASRLLSCSPHLLCYTSITTSPVSQLPTRAPEHETGNGELGASLPPPPLRPRRRRRLGLGGAPARHPHLGPVPPAARAGYRQRQQRQERHRVPRQREVPPRQAPLRRRAHGLRLPALRRSGRTRRRVRPRALLRVRHAVPVPRVPGRRGQEADRRLRRPRPARRRLDGRLLRVLRRREPLLVHLRRLPRARHHRRRRPRHQLVPRASEPRRPGVAPGAGRGRQREDAGGHGLDRRGERLQEEQHGARAGAVRAGPHGGGVRVVRPVLGAGGGDLRVVLVPPAVVAGLDGVAGAVVGFDCYLRFDVAVATATATATATSTAPARVPPLKRLGKLMNDHPFLTAVFVGGGLAVAAF